MLKKILSGGQTGADQAGWRSAKAYGISTGGWMPQGFLTEDGPRPEFVEQFDASEMPTESASARTERNVQEADGTIWFGETTTSGAQATVGSCCKIGKPLMLVYPAAAFEPSHVTKWIIENQIRVLNVAGNRESDEPGIGERVERFLGKSLEQLSRL
jgi:hypothetical protein